MLNYSFNEFVIIYSLYFVFHYLFRESFFFFFFKNDIEFTNIGIEWEK